MVVSIARLYKRKNSSQVTFIFMRKTDVGSPVVCRWKVFSCGLLNVWSYVCSKAMFCQRASDFVASRAQLISVWQFTNSKQFHKQNSATNEKCRLLHKFTSIVRHFHKATGVLDSDHSDVSTVFPVSLLFLFEITSFMSYVLQSKSQSTNLVPSKSTV